MEFTLQVPGQIEILGQFTNKWYEFVNHFQCAQNQSGHSKSSFLLHFGAQTIKDIQLGHKIPIEELLRLNAYIETLEVRCLFQIVLCFVRHLFFSHCRHAGSTVEEFYTELRVLSALCGFDNAICDSIVKNQLVGDIPDKSARDALATLNSLTASDVMDLCSAAEKKGVTIDSDFVNMHVMDQQRKWFHSNSTDSKTRKDYGWSSFPETQVEINQGLNLRPIFRTDSHCLGGASKPVLPYFSGKQNMCSNLVYSVTDPMSDHSFFQNKVNSFETACQQSNGHVTNYPPEYQPTTSYPVPYQDSHPPLSVTGQEKKAKELNLKDNSSKVAANKSTDDNDIVVDKNVSNSHAVADVSACDENNDDLLMCILDPNDESISDSGEHKPSVSYVGSKDDVNEFPGVFVSQQKAIMKTSQIMEATGQAVDVYSCNFCIFSCPGKSGMEEHAKQVHHSLKCFVCTACNMKFPSKEQIESHVRTKHLNVEEHKCQICDMVFVTQSKLFLHLQGHAETRTVTCRVCSAMFTTEKLLSEHMSTVHPDTDRWVCDICGDTFSLRKSLSDHNAAVHKDNDNEKISRRFVCKLCDITFTDKKSSEMHKRKFHRKAQTKRFPCDRCEHSCSSNANLISHMRIHTGEKPYMCEVCGKEFSQSSSLDKHTRIHTGEKPYKCQYCDLSFNTSSNRLVHERNHRKERPYVCEQCGKTYRNSYELKVHIDTHNEFRTKRFVCDCGVAFDTKRKLKRHQVCHSGQKPYKCGICGTGFTRSENVRGHQKSQACRNKVMKTSL